MRENSHTKRITAIVVTYNASEWISKCLNSLEASAVQVDTIVVDNLSGDDTVTIIEADFPQVTLVKSSQNLGFGGGNNLGLNLAIESNADYVFLLNQDAWIAPTTIEELIVQAGLHPEYGILSPLHLNGEGTLLDRYFQERIGSRERKLITDLFLGVSEEFYEVRFVNAAAWLLRMNCIKKVGLFDPIFFHYGEDGNYVDRCRYFGFKVGLSMRSRIWHDREERVSSTGIDRSYNFQKLRTGWLGEVTDPNDTNWADHYHIKALRYAFRNAFVSPAHFGRFFYTLGSLSRMKKEIEVARKRMTTGSQAYL